MYKISDSYSINPNKIASMTTVTLLDGKQKFYLTLIDGTKHEVATKELFDELAGKAGTATFDEMVITDKLSVGDIEDVEQAINNIEDFSDVKDVVACYDNTSDPSLEGKTDIAHYDTSKLNDLDIVEVLDDESQNHTNTMYKWHKNTSDWELIGSLGPYYTKDESDTKYVSEVSLEVEEPEEGESVTVSGAIIYKTGNGTKTTVVTFDQLRDIVSTPSPDTPDVKDDDYRDEELTLIVSDAEGNAVKMTLEELRQRFASSTDADNADFETAQIGQFLYEEISEVESLAEWSNINNQNAWEAEYNNPDSALRKYYAWSDDANKPYKEDLWNTVENRAARLSDARKDEHGNYILDENGNYIYDNCERCWLGAINAPGASYPWAVVELPIPFRGTIRFDYKDEITVYPWGESTRTFGRGFAIASVPDELNKPEMKINVAGEATVPLLEGDLIITLIADEEEGE